MHSDTKPFLFISILQMMIKELKTLYNECRSNSCIEHAMGIMEEEKAPEKLSDKISSISISGAGKKVQYDIFLLLFLTDKPSICLFSNIPHQQPYL